MEKVRHDLTPSHGMTEVAKVLTYKLNKYEKNQWKSGIKWTEVLSSLKKHLNEFELGNDYTQEGLLNIAEVATNALILSEYYHIFPQGDDRIIAPVNKPIVGLDIDDVCFDFQKAYEERFGVSLNPYWNGDYEIQDNLKLLENDKEFWLNLEVLNKPTFEVDFYITSRSIPMGWTEESLKKHGFPCAPVHMVPWNTSKLDVLKSLNVDIMIDDKFTTFKECNQNGIFCYLMDAKHNVHYNVGHKRIFDLNLNIK